MMTKKTSLKIALYKQLLLVPVLVIATILFSRANVPANVDLSGSKFIKTALRFLPADKLNAYNKLALGEKTKKIAYQVAPVKQVAAISRDTIIRKRTSGNHLAKAALCISDTSKNKHNTTIVKVGVDTSKNPNNTLSKSAFGVIPVNNYNTTKLLDTTGKFDFAKKQQKIIVGQVIYQ